MGSGELPSGLDYVRPSAAQCDRGSKIVHVAEVVEVDYPAGMFFSPKFTSLCGVAVWGRGCGPVTCRRCLASLARRKRGVR